MKQIFIICLLVTVCMSTHLNTDAYNFIRYGLNPIEETNLCFKEFCFQRPDIRSEIFSFTNQDTPVDHSCADVSSKIPTELTVSCDSALNAHNFNIAATIDLFNMYTTFSSLNVGNNQNLFGLNPEVTAFLDEWDDSPDYWQISILQEETLSYALPEVLQPELLDCNFRQDVARLGDTVTYEEFLIKYGTYFRRSVKVGSRYIAINKNVVDNNNFPANLDLEDFPNVPTGSITFNGGDASQIMTSGSPFSEWLSTSQENIVIVNESFSPVSDLLTSALFPDLQDINQKKTTLLNLIITQENAAPTLWELKTYPSAIIAIMFESGFVATAGNQDTSLSHNGQKVIDISINSQYVSYTKITHLNPAENIEIGEFSSDVLWAGRQNYLTAGLSIVTGFQFIDNNGPNGCNEIHAIVDGVVYEMCDFASFPNGFTNIALIDQSLF